MSMLGIEGKEWAIIFATLAGPILAVQAQKWVERARQRSQRKDWIFHTLMAYRGSRMNSEFVRALNMISLAFYGKRFFGRPWRSRKEQAVLDAWQEYFRHVSHPAPRDQWQAWNATTDEMLVNVIRAIGEQVGYELDREAIRAGGYTPQGPVDLENELTLMRRGLIAVLDGRIAIPVSIRDQAEPPPPQPALPLIGGGPAAP